MAMSYIVGVYGWYSGFRVCEIRQCIRYSTEVEAGSDTLQLDMFNSGCLCDGEQISQQTLTGL